MNKNKLPNNLSDLIDVAIADLKKCEKSKHYKIDMRDWHMSDIDAICSVCLAGSVMAQTCNVSRMGNHEPYEFGEDIERKLLALDEIRAGCIYDAFLTIGFSKEEIFQKLNEDLIQNEVRWLLDSNYKNNESMFKRKLTSLAKKLRGMGL